MRRTGFLALGFALALAWATPANADDILFDPDGAGPLAAVTIDLMDPTVGNAITLGLNAGSQIGDTGTVLFQANLGITSLDGGIANVTSCVAGADCFTFVAALDVVVTGSDADSFTFELDLTGDTNVFKMYANDPPLQGDNLSGQCFASLACGGTEIVSGEFEQFIATFTGENVTPELLDQFGGDNYGGVLTVVGGGEFDGIITILSHLSSYFPNLVDGATLFIASSEQQLPYDQANPSECFSSNAVANCDQPGVASVGAVNGLGNNTMTQTDASISFQQPAAIPEPASLLLLGSGLVGAAAARRRRQRKN